MFRFYFRLLPRTDEVRKEGRSYEYIEEFLSRALDEDEADPEFAVHNAAERLAFANLFESYYEWGEKRISVGMYGDAPFLLSHMPAACVAMENRKDFDITIFQHPDVSKLHLIFESGKFVCEDREWGRDTKLLHRAEEDGPSGLIENFVQTVALFSVVVKRVYPNIYHFGPFQDWLHTFEPAYRKMEELDLSPGLDV